MTNRQRRKANEARRDRAHAKQIPLHMRGLRFHPAHGVPVPGQLDRAEARAAEHAARYPRPPVYVTKIGTVG